MDKGEGAEGCAAEEACGAAADMAALDLEPETPRETCDPAAAAWTGPLHEVPRHDLAAPEIAPTVAGPQRLNALSGRYLLYSPCVSGSEVGRCYGQFNNQLALLLHALAVAAAMGRVLVLPPNPNPYSKPGPKPNPDPQLNPWQVLVLPPNPYPNSEPGPKPEPDP